MAEGRRAAAGWLLVIALLGAVVAFPLAELLAAGVAELGRVGAGVLLRPGAGRAAVNTLWTAVVVTLLAVAGGTAAALVTERSGAPGRRWLRLALLLSLLVPPFVSALSWVRAYGPGGLTDDLLGASLPGLYGPGGVVAVMAVHGLPLAYLVVAAGLASRAEPDLQRAARVSGAGPVRTLVGVTIPLLGPALLGASALVFVGAVNAFGIPAVLGIPAGFLTVTTRIYQDLAFAADPASFARAVLLACGLVLLAVVVIGAADAFLGGVGSVVRPAGQEGPSAPSGRPSRLPPALLWAYLAVTTFLPLLALVLMALTRAVGLDPVPANWTLAHFAEALAGRFGAALGRSLLLATSAATAAVLLGSLLTALRRSRWGRGLGTAALLTFAVPGSTLAVATLLAYGSWLRDTLLIILVAYLAKFWAVGHRTLAGSADAIPPDLHRAARASGASGRVTLRTVTVPLLLPAVAGAWALVFLFGLHELTMSSLLYGPGTDTLAVVILNLQQLGDVSVTSALAVLLTLPVLAAALPILVLRGPVARMLGAE